VLTQTLSPISYILSKNLTKLEQKLSHRYTAITFTPIYITALIHHTRCVSQTTQCETWATDMYQVITDQTVGLIQPIGPKETMEPRVHIHTSGSQQWLMLSPQKTKTGLHQRDQLAQTLKPITSFPNT